MARGRNATAHTMAQLSAARELYRYYHELPDAGRSWAAVGIHYGINKGLAQAVALGKKRAPPAVLLALGMEEATAPAPVCPVHHVVHVMPGCPDEYEARRRPTLRPREVEVIALVAEGLGDKAIAGRLVVSYKTVKSHLSNIRARLGSLTRVELANYYREYVKDKDHGNN